MKKRSVLCVFFLLCYTATFAQGLTPVQKHGALRVLKGKILNQSGVEPQLRGISLSWSIWAGRKYYNREVVNWLATDFKISLLRISMAIEPDGGYLQDPLGQEKLITKTLDAAIEKGLYVLLDWHDHHAEDHQQQAKAFFGKMAKRYAGVPNVIYEIYNEPERADWGVVKAYALTVIKEIRKHDPDGLIVVGSPHWDQDIDVVAKNPIKGFKNIAYSFHFYASEPHHQAPLMARAEETIAAGLPIFITEWGVGEANGNGKFDQEKTDKWFAWMEKHKLSWANWNITDKKETTALLMPGATITGQWPITMLTPAGQYIRTQLRTLNQ